MDADRFDSLVRALSDARSRRAALRGLLATSLGLFTRSAVEDASAKNCKKITNKKKRKKCLAKAKSTPTPTAPCTRNCAGKTCGDDGCGGSCGDCFRGSCQGGVCVCPTGEEVCKGACRAKCAQSELRDPDTCRCCTANERQCGLGSQCCSGDCGFNSSCQGRNGLVACTWDEQCQSGVCEAGACTCVGDTCKGICREPCSPTRATRDPISCECCVKNGETCVSGTCTCCCSGACDGPVGQAKPCVGLLDGAACSFDAQCASGKCAPDPFTTEICAIEKYCQPK
jgi:hypothetical protein